MKKIAIFLPNLHGNGASKVSIQQAEALYEQGHCPVLFIFNKEGELPVPAHITTYYLFDEKTNKNDQKSIIEEHIRQAQEKFGPFDLFLSNTPKCDVLISKCNLDPVFYVCHCALKKEIINAFFQGPKKFIKRLKQAFVWHNKDIIAVSHGINNELSKLPFIKPKSIQTIYNAFPIEKIKSLANEKNPEIPDERYIIHVGRVASQKRHDILLKAIKLNPNLPKLVLLSNKPEKIKSMAKKLHMDNRILAKPFQKNPYPWIKHADALILSSDYEGLPTVLIEALICETPIVSIDCEYGPKEIMSGSLSKYLAKYRDPQDLCDKLTQLLKDKPQLQECNILKKVTNEYISSQLIGLIST